MLDGTFEERLSNIWHGIRILLEKFCQWASAHVSMVSQSKSSYFAPYLVVTLQNQIFK